MDKDLNPQDAGNILTDKGFGTTVEFVLFIIVGLLLCMDIGMMMWLLCIKRDLRFSRRMKKVTLAHNEEQNNNGNNVDRNRIGDGHYMAQKVPDILAA